MPHRSFSCNAPSLSTETIRDTSEIPILEAESGTGTILTRGRRKAGQVRGGKRGGKRDGYDIDKMGSFGLWFGDATYSAGRSWCSDFR